VITSNKFEAVVQHLEALSDVKTDRCKLFHIFPPVYEQWVRSEVFKPTKSCGIHLTH